MYHLNVLLWPVSHLLCLFPFLHILPVGWSRWAEDTPPLTNPIVCLRQSLRLRLYFCLSAGMLLQDTHKLLAVVLPTVCVSLSEFLCFSTRCSRPSYPLLDQRAPLALSQCASVGEWLRAIKMERYEDSFLQAGFNSVDQLAQITTQSVPISSFII